MFYNYNKMFIAEVTATYPQRVSKKETISGTQITQEVVNEAYTIDVLPPISRMPIRGVRVLIPCSGSGNNGFAWLPNVGDTVICGYLENYPDFAICLGSMYNPAKEKPSTEFKSNDFIVHHQSNSFVRIRDLEKSSNPSSKNSRSEITIKHKTEAEITVTEPEKGKVEININHPTGAKFKIDKDGNVEITSIKSVKMLGKNVIIGDEAKARPVHNEQTIPMCLFTGTPYRGIPNCKVGP